MTGQVATTSVVAQMTAGRNGRNIQKQVPISPATKKTARVVRVRSDRPSMPHEPLGGLSATSRADHRLQPVPVWIAKINGAILPRAAANRDPLLLELGLERFVAA